MDKEPIGELELRAIVDHEVRSAMGEIGGELAEERTAAMDYYLGEPVGKLANPAADRSNVVITTVRDTVEWLLPQLMRLFAQPDAVVEFAAISADDEPAAKQETQGVNHIFWRQNEGFLILYTWFKDALLQKNGVVKYWVDETEDRSTEEYDGLTDQALAKMLEDEELEAIEHDVSDVKSVDGQELHHVVFERIRKETKIVVTPIPPEELLISNDARSLDIQEDRPRFVGHYPEKTLSELRDMGFSEKDLESMKRGDERWDELDEEWIARYNLSDEQEISDQYSHESMRKLRVLEAYMRLDIDGDGYAELVKIFRVGEFISHEEVDHIPFAALTPTILSHKFFGLSVFDMVHDLQEVGTATVRNVLDNMYQVNNTRPVINQRVDVDSLLTSRPGAPIYIDDEGSVNDAIAPFSPPPMWKDGLGLLEYLDGVRKDRTGVGDETMGLDPATMASANTGVVLSAIEAARGKIELIARIFAETGVKWLFRGIHELARKNYGQKLSYKLNKQFVEVDPREWRKRTNLVVNVGTATGNTTQKQFALQQVGQVQAQMVQAGLMGKTVIPSNIFQTGRDLADVLGLHGDKFFLNPMTLIDPKVQQLVKLQLPQPAPDAQMAGVQAMAEAEKMKAQVAAEKVKADVAMKQEEIKLRHLEASGKEELAVMKQQLEETKVLAQSQSEQERLSTESSIKVMEADIKLREQEFKSEMELMKIEAKAQADLVKIEAQAQVDLIMKQQEEVFKQREGELKVGMAVFQAEVGSKLEKMEETYKAELQDTKKKLAEAESASRSKIVKYDEDGKIISIG